jgi:hypothetical protein
MLCVPNAPFRLMRRNYEGLVSISDHQSSGGQFGDAADTDLGARRHGAARITDSRQVHTPFINDDGHPT